MDQHDQEACGTENDNPDSKCSAQQDHLQLKASSLPGNGTFSDEMGRIEKLSPCHHGHEIETCKAAKLSKSERKSYIDASSPHCAKQNKDRLGAPCSVVSRISNSVSVNKNCAKETTVENEENSKDFDVSSHLVGATDCQHNIFMKKETSSEDGETLDKHENEMLDGGTTSRWVHAEENGFKSTVQGTYHNKQLKTESSSSNSTRAIFPASSIDSCEEASVHEKPPKCCQTEVNHPSFYTGLKCRQKELGAGSFTLGLAMENCCTAVLDVVRLPGKTCNLDSVPELSDNTKGGSDKLLGDITDHRSVTGERNDVLKSSPPKRAYAGLDNQDEVENCYDLDDVIAVARRVAREVEEEFNTDREAPGNCSFILRRCCETVDVNAADSLALDRENYLTETGVETQFYGEQDNRDGFCSNKVVVNQEILTGEQQMHLDNVDSSPGLDSTKARAVNCGQESSCIITNCDDLAANDQTIQPFQIDLNEDIVVNEVKCTEQLIDETVSYHLPNVLKPTPATAKSGLVGLPLYQLHLEDTVGWRGPAATSAFGKTSHSQKFNLIRASSANDNGKCSKDLQVEGIDLNIAAANDFDVELLQEKCVLESSSFPSKESLAEGNLTQAERFNIDLNLANEYDENCLQIAPPASVRNIANSFDLNVDPTCQVARYNGDQPSQCTAESGARASDTSVSFLGNARQQKFNYPGSTYSADPGNLQVFNHGHARPFLLAVSNFHPAVEQMQEIVYIHGKAYIKQNPQPQPALAFPYGNGCCTEPTRSVIPYIIYQNGPSVFRQLQDSGTLQPDFSIAPSFLQIHDGPLPNSFAIIRPGFDPRSMGENARQQFVPLGNSSMEEQMMKSLQPVKRKEPEGGWDLRQLDYRRVMP